MKRCKKERGGIFLLLIKNYIFFSIVILALGIIISTLLNMAFERTSEFALGLNDKDIQLLMEEKFNKLNVKSIAGLYGVIEVLDENNHIIYSSSNNKKEYTERELNLIPNYCEDETFIDLYEFQGSDNKTYKVLISTIYDFDENGEVNNSIENSWLKVLDEDLNVVYSVGQNIDDITVYTEKELGYLRGNYSSKYNFTKYYYTNNEGASRTLIMKEKKVNIMEAFKGIDKMYNISFVIFFLACIICIILFGMFLKRKVQKPLNKLNRAMQLLSEGKENEPIVYSGPKEFVEICDSFNVMVNKLESSEIERNKLIKDKQSMLADISHDLKTPITTIQGYAKALADGVIFPDEYEKYFNIIYAKSKRLTELINIFYEYSKLEHPDFKLVFEKIDLAEYLRAYVAGKYEDILESGFDIDVDIPEEILECKIDTVQFQRVLDNLLGNSMKHNPVGTKIYVSLSVVKNKYKIIIADNGVGIPKEISENIFSPFIVGDESRNTKQGSGLGLAIVKSIVEKHGGKIKLNTSDKFLNGEYTTIFEIIIS